MDTQALKVSDTLTVVGVSPDDTILFHMPENMTDEDYVDFKELFVKEESSQKCQLPCAAIFMPAQIRMTVIKPIKKEL